MSPPSIRPVPYEERNFDLVPFEEASRIEQTSPHDYQANIHPAWSYGSSAHGGFLMAVVWRAVEVHFATTLKTYGQPGTVALHIEYLRPAMLGPVTIQLRDARLGKVTSTVGFALRQGDKIACEGFVTNGGPRVSKGAISMDLGYRPTPTPPPIDFAKVLDSTDPHWIRFDILKKPKVPNHALCNLIFTVQRSPPAQGNFSQWWISPRLPTATWTTPMLGVLVDSAVPTPEDFFPDATHSCQKYAERGVRNEAEGKSTWDHPYWKGTRYYPTVSFNLEVKRQLPPEGVKWLALRWHAKEVVNGRFDSSVEVWDAQDRLILTAQSVWYVVDTSSVPGGSFAKRVQNRWEDGKDKAVTSKI